MKIRGPRFALIQSTSLTVKWSGASSRVLTSYSILWVPQHGYLESRRPTQSSITLNGLQPSTLYRFYIAPVVGQQRGSTSTFSYATGMQHFLDYKSIKNSIILYIVISYDNVGSTRHSINNKTSIEYLWNIFKECIV